MSAAPDKTLKMDRVTLARVREAQREISDIRRQALATTPPAFGGHHEMVQYAGHVTRLAVHAEEAAFALDRLELAILHPHEVLLKAGM